MMSAPGGSGWGGCCGSCFPDNRRDWGMSKSFKLTLDILIGAALPIVILKYGTAPLGVLPAYLLAGLLPVGWVLLDLALLTRQFNFISAYGGWSAIMRGALAFWFVDGALLAFKDSASYLFAVAVFGVPLVFGKPVTRSIALQGLAPDTDERRSWTERLLATEGVRRALWRSSAIIAGTNLLAGVANFAINWWMVRAAFGTPLFNDQVANVNAITRLVLVLPDMIALFWAFRMMYRAIYAELPASEQIDHRRGDFWELVKRREDALAIGRTGDHASLADEADSPAVRHASVSPLLRAT